MLQIIFMVLGIMYLFKLLGLSKAGANLGFPPETFAEWQAERKRQYVWGIVAGWGSFLVSVLVAKATIDPDGYYTEEEALNAVLPSLLIGIAVLIAGMIASIRAGGRAKAIENRSSASRVSPLD